MTTSSERDEFLRSLTPLTVEDLVRYAEISGLNEQLQDALDAQYAEAHKPCESEYYSWWIFTPEQADPYWMRCTLTGPHDEHEDSNTGAHWTDKT